MLRSLCRTLEKLGILAVNHDLAAPLAFGEVWVLTHAAEPVHSLFDGEHFQFLADHHAVAFERRCHCAERAQRVKLTKDTKKEMATCAEDSDARRVILVF